MAFNEQQGSFAARLSHFYGNIRNCFQALSELEQLEPELQHEIAADLGIDRNRCWSLTARRRIARRDGASHARAPYRSGRSAHHVPGAVSRNADQLHALSIERSMQP